MEWPAVMPPIIIVDTSVLLNVLAVPGCSQDRDVIGREFAELIEADATFHLPMGAVFETGNHIAAVPDGRQRRQRAEVLRDHVREAVAGRAPWVLVPLPDTGQLMEWLEGFPESATRGAGMVDLSIVKAWKQACTRHPGRRVRIWALDQHLAGYDRVPASSP